jgi:hypothetical protein
MRLSDVPFGTDGVYFLEAAGLIKIGYTRGIVGRVGELRRISPVPLTLLGYVATPYGRSLEALLHRQYAVDRSHGEWFRASPVMREHLLSLGRGEGVPVLERCNVARCSGKPVAFGLCNRHYQRRRRAEAR